MADRLEDLTELSAAAAGDLLWMQRRIFGTWRDISLDVADLAGVRILENVTTMDVADLYSNGAVALLGNSPVGFVQIPFEVFTIYTPDTTPNGLTQTFSLLTEDGGNYLGTQTIPLDSTRRGGVLFQGTLVNTFDLATLAAGLNFEGTSLFTTGDGSLTVTVRFVLWPL